MDQNQERQIVTLKKHDIEKWFEEKVSAKDTNRPKLKEMLDFARNGDTIYISDFSRIARSTKDLLDIIDVLQAKNIRLISDKEAIDTDTSTGKLMLTMIGAINEFERANMLDRQREGIAIAKKAGKYKGRKPVKIDREEFIAEYIKYVDRKTSKSQMARTLKISRPTMDKLMKDYEATRSNEFIHPDSVLGQMFKTAIISLKN